MKQIPLYLFMVSLAAVMTFIADLSEPTTTIQAITCFVAFALLFCGITFWMQCRDKDEDRKAKALAIFDEPPTTGPHGSEAIHGQQRGGETLGDGRSGAGDGNSSRRGSRYVKASTR